MKSKIASKYEEKRWYRIVKTLYIILFVLLLVIANFIIWISASNDSSGDYLLPFVITNAVVIFGMGTLEGLFWYIVRGKWGYPKDDESADLASVSKIDISELE
jgi:hypothetical protein